MMKVTTTMALAAVLATAAAPALADEWIYHGGPKSPGSLTWYAEDDAYAYGPAYAYYGYRYGPAPTYGGYDPHRYRCGPATVDCYNRSRQLQGTR